MEAKHTPGPWVYVEIARTPDGRECGQLIGPASCAALIVEQDGSDAGAANVALAAAAPELLAALQEIVAEASSHGGPKRTVCRVTVDRASAAIARAEGRANA